MNTVEEEVVIPLKTPQMQVRVIALHKGKEPGPFQYLQGIRQGTLRAISVNPETTQVARSYHANKQQYFPLLANKVTGTVDAILSPRAVYRSNLSPTAKQSQNCTQTQLISRVGLIGLGKPGQERGRRFVMSLKA
jgi:hypothetical protein